MGATNGGTREWLRPCREEVPRGSSMRQAVPRGSAVGGVEYDPEVSFSSVSGNASSDYDRVES